MAGDGTATIPRRAIISAAVAGAAASAAAVAAQGVTALMPGAVAAADGDVVRVGQDNAGTASTWISTTAGVPSLGGSSDDGDGVTGKSSGPMKSGVYGVNASEFGYGVFGRNSKLNATGYLGGPGHGVWGESGVDKYSGVYGRATGADAFGVSGAHVPSGNMGRLGDAYAGVEGQSKTTDGVKGQTSGQQKSGVFGVADDTTGFGVYGYNTKTRNTGHLGGPQAGVEGVNPDSGTKGQLGGSGAGAFAIHIPTGNTGWLGTSAGAVLGSHGKTHASGVIGGELAGVQAQGAATTPALHVAGSVVLLRSGMATVPKGKSSVQVTGWGAHGTVEIALAVPTAYRAGVGVAATIVDGMKGTVTIYLTKAVTATTPVAFFLLGGPEK